jgi:hypothetical protein
MDCGWEWLRVRCGYCHRSARIMFAASRREETLDSLARKARWRRCPDLTPLIDFKLGVETDVREKAIAFEGDRPHEARVGNDEPTSMQIGSVWLPADYPSPPNSASLKQRKRRENGLRANRPSGLNGAKFYARSSISSSPHARVAATQHLPLSRRVPQIRGWPSGHLSISSPPVPPRKFGPGTATNGLDEIREASPRSGR